MICFAHSAYRLGDAFRRRRPETPYLQVHGVEELRARIAEAEVLVVSGMWRNDFAALAPRLRLIQSVSAGTDLFSHDVLREHGIRLASAQGVNERAVAHHAMALMLGLVRHLHVAHRDQGSRHWRGMIGDPAARQDELAGKTLVIVGLGRIGTRLARLAAAFDMRIVGVRRRPKEEGDAVDEIVSPDRLLDILPQADMLALTCPLTPETERMIRAEHFAAMRPGAYLINVARGKVVDQAALVSALGEGRIAGAGLDVTDPEPLPADSPLWAMDNVILTPHTAGETQRYEAGVVDLLIDNLGRLERGEALRNAIV